MVKDEGSEGIKKQDVIATWYIVLFLPHCVYQWHLSLLQTYLPCDFSSLSPTTFICLSPNSLLCAVSDSSQSLEPGCSSTVKWYSVATDCDV